MIEFHSNAAIMAEARQMQSEAIARFALKVWRWCRTALHIGSPAGGVAAR